MLESAFDFIAVEFIEATICYYSPLDAIAFRVP